MWLDCNILKVKAYPPMSSVWGFAAISVFSQPCHTGVDCPHKSWWMRRWPARFSVRHYMKGTCHKRGWEGKTSTPKGKANCACRKNAQYALLDLFRSQNVPAAKELTGIWYENTNKHVSRAVKIKIKKKSTRNHMELSLEQWSLSHWEHAYTDKAKDSFYFLSIPRTP